MHAIGQALRAMILKQAARAHFNDERFASDIASGALGMAQDIDLRRFLHGLNVFPKYLSIFCRQFSMEGFCATSIILSNNPELSGPMAFGTDNMFGLQFKKGLTTALILTGFSMPGFGNSFGGAYCIAS